MGLVKSYLYESGSDGPRLIVLGAIHGDEPCGPEGIQRVMQKIDTGELELRAGSVCFVPIANPEAYQAQERELSENLNRILRKTDNPTLYEAKLANELCALIDEADVMLDIHSSHANAPVNIFIDYPTPTNIALASAIGAEYAIYDWPKVYENNAHAFNSYTSDWYAHESGASGVLFECGQHNDPNAITIAEEAILRTLVHTGLCDGVPGLDHKAHTGRAVYMKHIFARESQHDVFMDEWSHLQLVAENTLIAKRSDGSEIRAERESVIIFPKPYAKDGGEWFYLGVLDNP